MKKRFPVTENNDALVTMSALGYQSHCSKDGRLCFHRPFNDVRFPCFHAYVTQMNHWMEIDLHIDALDSIHHKGNHDQQWAYQGGRIVDEMQRITNLLEGVPKSMIVGTERLTKKYNPRRVVKNIIDLLFL